MSTGVLEEIVAGRLRGIPRMNAAQFEKYMLSGLAGENVHCELIDGYPVLKDSSAAGGDPMIMGARHALVVNALNRRLVRLVSEPGWGTTCQTPINVSDSDVFEPDLSVYRGNGPDFMPDYVDPSAICLLIEVADSSVAADRNTKKPAYARAGVPTYWIVNLDEDQLEVYTSPNREHESYSHCQTLYSNEDVEFNIPGLPAQKLSVQQILDGTI